MAVGLTATMPHDEAAPAGASHSDQTPFSISDGPIPAPTASTVELHPDHDEIIRQVEYYFSDENLPHDAHLLAKTGNDGNGKVSVNQILGFKKMRKYKPKSRVIASLRQSTLVEVIDNKFLKRRIPLTVPLKVVPKLNDIEESQAKVLEAKPWLTKAMLKPTGFEEYANDGPLRPEEYAIEQKLYDPEEAFYIRIETAVARYMTKRKLHSLTANILTKFLKFGGFDTSQRQFGSKQERKDLEKTLTKDEFIQLTNNFTVSELVLDSYCADDPSEQDIWEVNFEIIAKSFLSSHFMCHFSWYDQETVETACHVLPNFYNYLLYHNVCPEYTKQILAARAVCGPAEKELLKLGHVDRALPGNVNMAFSTLHDGSYAGLYRDVSTGEDWADGVGDISGLSQKDAFTIFATAVMAHGTAEQVQAFEQAAAEKTPLKKLWSQDIGLEVVGVEFNSPGTEAHAMYSSAELHNTLLKPIGKLHCIPWRVPQNPPITYPEGITADSKLEFLIEESILRLIYPGMKMEAEVGCLAMGMMWLDRVIYVYPSFFTWTDNERVQDVKQALKDEERRKLKMLQKANGQDVKEDSASEGFSDEDD